MKLKDKGIKIKTLREMELDPNRDQKRSDRGRVYCLGIVRNLSRVLLRPRPTDGIAMHQWHDHPQQRDDQNDRDRVFNHTAGDRLRRDVARPNRFPGNHG